MHFTIVMTAMAAVLASSASANSVLANNTIASFRLFGLRGCLFNYLDDWTAVEADARDDVCKTFGSKTSPQSVQIVNIAKRCKLQVFADGACNGPKRTGQGEACLGVRSRTENFKSFRAEVGPTLWTTLHPIPENQK
ncbi:hypothetical protein RJ55_07419 [Drechmeria coniospora]|nr:hypothetical protein RJ55_07419 [Drechmeria coniospora]